MAKPATPSSTRDNIEAAGKFLALVSTVIGLAAAGNTLLASREKQNSDAYSAFRTSVATEERAWRDLYNEYLKTFEEAEFKNAELRKRKLFAYQALASRDVSTFPEFAVDARDRDTARLRIVAIRESLLKSLADSSASDPATAQALQQRTFNTEKASAAAEAPPAQGVAPTPGVDTTAGLSREMTALTGQSPTGWDVDLFWCQGNGEAANLRLAWSFGNAFASYARSARPIAPGVTLGRIRVRPLTPQGWRNIGFRSPGVVHDSGPGEREAAEAIRSLVNGSIAAGQPVFGLGRSLGKPTPWYISVFACPPQAGRAAPPASRSS